MKKLLFLFALLSIFSCKNTSEKEVVTEEASEEISEMALEGYNNRVPDEEDGGEMLLGKITCKGLQEEPFNEWYVENYNAHVLDSVRIDSIKPLLKNISIKIFMGTWCEDSQKQVPALEKILYECDYTLESLDMVAVTHNKDTPNGLEDGYELEYVPTIIFYKDGAEINRIVEYPQETLEQDILTILSGKPYKHAYAE
ncbi:MAG: thioredoxin family protein [Flavobacteriaceae bacterium]